MIKVENLVYEYPGKRALDNISFEIPEGSVTALVGPNGAGKTTLLKCLAALSKPFGGRIFIRAVNVLKEPRKCHKMIGFLGDFFGLYDSLTVRQTLTYFALAQNVWKENIPGRVAEVVGQLNLKDKTDEKVGSLSRGMRQRLGIGQAMIHDPEVLLLDEPASGLDPEARYALSKLFLKLNRAGKTLVVSSHILSELDQYATDLLIMRNGKIVDRNVSAGVPVKKKTIRIKVLDDPDMVRKLLENAAHIEAVSIRQDELSLIFTGNEADQHHLLKFLMDSNISVREFYVRKEGIQEQYLETVV